MIKNFLSDLKKAYLRSKRQKYLGAISSIMSDSPSLISNNCFAGRIYQDLQIPYNSPTVGLYFFYPDYINFLEKLESNLNGRLRFVNSSKYDLGNARMKASKHDYPVALLNDDIEMHFLHYKSKDDAERKWYRRCERVNINKVVTFGCELDLCKEEDIKNFDNLQFAKKFFFTSNDYNLDSAIFIKEFLREQYVGDPYRYGHVFYKYLASRIERDEK